MQNKKQIEKALRVFNSVKLAYGHMATNRSSFNLMYQNVILSIVVSSKNGASQSFISKTIGARKYSLKKTII
jgi:hypothetical protein